MIPGFSFRKLGKLGIHQDRVRKHWQKGGVFNSVLRMAHLKEARKKAQDCRLAEYDYSKYLVIMDETLRGMITYQVLELVDCYRKGGAA